MKTNKLIVITIIVALITIFITVFVYLEQNNNIVYESEENYFCDMPLWIAENEVIFLETTISDEVAIKKLDLNTYESSLIVTINKAINPSINSDNIQVNSSGDTILINSKDKPRYIKIYNNTKIQPVIHQLNSIINPGVYMSPNGEYIVGIQAYSPWKIKIFKTNEDSSKVITGFDSDKIPGSAFVVLDNGNLIYTTQSGNIYIINTKNNNYEHITRVIDNTDYYPFLFLSPDNKNVAYISSSSQGAYWTFAIIDIESKNVDYYKLNGYIHRPNISWSLDSKYVVLGYYEYDENQNEVSHIKILNTINGELTNVKTYKGRFISGVSFSPDNKKIIFSLNNRELRIIDVESK